MVNHSYTQYPVDYGLWHVMVVSSVKGQHLPDFTMPACFFDAASLPISDLVDSILLVGG
jgi:hypothetical protein